MCGEREGQADRHCEHSATLEGKLASVTAVLAPICLLAPDKPQQDVEPSYL